jgi:hypothetical protein
VEVACPKVTGFGGGGFDSGQSFKNALMHSTRQGGEVSGGVDTMILRRSLMKWRWIDMF